LTKSTLFRSPMVDFGLARRKLVGRRAVLGKSASWM
jgi:hypothetical protein